MSDERVSQLLLDAGYAESGSQFALTVGYVEQSYELAKKRDDLLSKARRLDPEHKDPAWQMHAVWLWRFQ